MSGQFLGDGFTTDWARMKRHWDASKERECCNFCPNDKLAVGCDTDSSLELP